VHTTVNAEVSRLAAGSHALVLTHGRIQTEALAVVLAAGGKAMPQLGGGESGLRLATSLGHRAVPVYPGLVPLKTDCPFNRQLKGTKVDATVTLEMADGTTASQRGEVLFTEYGLSGPPLIQLSLPAARTLHDGRSARLVLDLFADWDLQRLSEHLQVRFARAGAAPLEHALVGFCHKRLILPLLLTAGISKTASAASSIALAPRLASLCKAWPLRITGSLSYNEAHVMCGGINCVDVESHTLQSRKVEGLYLTGELLDVTGDCGGYNLQWAWSSGHVAGTQAAQWAARRG
jgi:predicted Rossmann fold flavoprotein